MEHRKINKSDDNLPAGKFLKTRINSFGFAINGIFLLFRTEIHARIHLLATIFVIILGFFLKISGTDWCIIALTCSAVISAEAFNTAIETMVNLISPDIHPLAGRAKDIAAGAVLIMSIGALIVGIIIFVPYFFLYFKHH